MAGDNFQKKRSGDPFSMKAPLYNALIETVKRSKANEQNLTRVIRHDLRDADVIRIRNDSGADRSRFEILVPDQPIFTPTDSLPEFQRQVAMDGITPLTAHRGLFAILQEPIPDGDVGKAIISGATVCLIAVTDAAHKFADVTNADATKLTSGTEGSARILWKEFGTGDKWAVVRLSNLSGCPAKNAIHQLAIAGKPTGGTLDIKLTVNGSQETLTFNYNDTAAAFKTELETHTQIAVGDVAVTGGPFPNAIMQYEFQANLANTDIALPLPDWNSLTGGTGVVAQPSLAQRGASG